MAASWLSGAFLATNRPFAVRRHSVPSAPCSSLSPYCYSVLSWLLGSLLFTGCSRLTSQRPSSHSAYSWLLGIRTIEPSCLLCACCACVYSLHSGRLHHGRIVNIGEKVRSTVGMRYCRKCYVKYWGENVYSLEALLAPRGKSVTTRQIPQVERAGQSHCCLTNTQHAICVWPNLRRYSCPIIVV